MRGYRELGGRFTERRGRGEMVWPPVISTRESISILAQGHHAGQISTMLHGVVLLCASRGGYELLASRRRTSTEALACIVRTYEAGGRQCTTASRQERAGAACLCCWSPYLKHMTCHPPINLSPHALRMRAGFAFIHRLDSVWTRSAAPSGAITADARLCVATLEKREALRSHHRWIKLRVLALGVAGQDRVHARRRHGRPSVTTGDTLLVTPGLSSHPPDKACLSLKPGTCVVIGCNPSRRGVRGSRPSTYSTSIASFTLARCSQLARLGTSYQLSLGPREQGATAFDL
jgi:hypothetical protein